MIYLDNAATTYPKPEEVYLALDKANRTLAFNAGRGEYKESTEAFNLINDTRIGLASLIGRKSNEVIFTSSATESLNLIINGIRISEGNNIYVSPFEHNAVVRPLEQLRKKINFQIRILEFNKETWLPELDSISDEFVVHPPKAVFISHISNVTGYVIPYEEIFKISNQYNAINVLDCAQSFGVVNPTNISNVNYLVFAGHKSLYASFGIAGFFKLKDDLLEVVKSGGTGSDSLNPEMPIHIPYKYEAGSPNIVAIAGLNESIKWLKKTDIRSKEMQIYDYLFERIKELDNVIAYHPKNSKTFGVLSINVDGYKSDEVATILNDEYDICLRAGYHCAPYVHAFLGTIETQGTVRISLNYYTSKRDIDVLTEALQSL